MKTTIITDHTKECYIYFEHSIPINGCEYFLIFGHHTNGGFICIPNWNICCEASDSIGSVGYNASKLLIAGISQGFNKEIVTKLALHIEEFLENIKAK